MDSRLKELLKPEIINTMDGLELVARVITEGFMSGSNKSQSIGAGQEFSQYRNYQVGDDLRQLDWKMYARSERYFIKQAEIETNITVKFMLDASLSMAYREDVITKLDYAKVMIAALAYLARKQSDTFGLFTVNNDTVTILQPRFEQQQFMRFLHALISVEAKSAWRKSGLEHFFDHHRKEIIVFITDLYDEDHDLLEFIARLKTSRNEVIIFHLLGKNEIELDYSGSFTFKDLERGATIKVDTSSQKKLYSERVKSWINRTRISLLEKAIHYHLVRMDEPIDHVLRNFLKTRKSLMR